MLGELQRSMGMGLRDIAMLTGPIAFVLGLLIVGYAGTRRGRRLIGWLGWLILIGGLVVAVYGMLPHGGSDG